MKRRFHKNPRLNERLNRDFCQNSAKIAIIPRNPAKNREFRRYFSDLLARLIVRSYRDLLDDYFWPVGIHKKHQKIHEMIDLFLRNGHHTDLFSLLNLLISCFPIFRRSAFISNFWGSSLVRKLDWDIDSGSPLDGLFDSMCLSGDDPMVLQQM